MKINKIDIGKQIKEMVDEKIGNYSHFARKIGKSRQNVNTQIFKKQSIDTLLLSQICEVLDYNFFALYYDSEENVINYNNKATVKATIEMELTEKDIKTLGIKDKIIKQLK